MNRCGSTLSRLALRVGRGGWPLDCGFNHQGMMMMLSTSGRPLRHGDSNPGDGGSYSKDHFTHFGFQTVSEEEKVGKVLNVFHNVADSYDMMNDAMSLGIHRLWKDYFVSVLAPHRGMKLLDVAGGTGDIAFRVLDALEKRAAGSKDRLAGGHVTCCDINESMLRVGQDRAAKLGYPAEGISWRQGDAQDLPFEDNSFDAYTIAFGIRNVVKVDQALKEALRVLKPGGRFLCLEFSQVSNPVIGELYDFYSFQLIPPMGKILAGDWESYQYLVESIRQFPDQETFKSMIKEAGFRSVTYENLAFGVVSVHSGFKL